jgi:hypothetical protein
MSFPPASRRRTLVRTTKALVLTVAVAGCGMHGPSVGVHPVSGKVLLANGKPLTAGTIHFEPIKTPGLKATGKIQPDGTFTLSTHMEGDGAAEGENRVYVEPDAPFGGAGKKKASPPFPFEYMDEESSPLVVTIKPGTNQLEPIVLKPQSLTKAAR